MRKAVTLEEWRTFCLAHPPAYVTMERPAGVEGAAASHDPRDATLLAAPLTASPFPAAVASTTILGPDGSARDMGLASPSFAAGRAVGAPSSATAVLSSVVAAAAARRSSAVAAAEQRSRFAAATAAAAAPLALRGSMLRLAGVSRASLSSSSSSSLLSSSSSLPRSHSVGSRLMSHSHPLTLGATASSVATSDPADMPTESNNVDDEPVGSVPAEVDGAAAARGDDAGGATLLLLHGATMPGSPTATTATTAAAAAAAAAAAEVEEPVDPCLEVSRC